MLYGELIRFYYDGDFTWVVLDEVNRSEDLSSEFNAGYLE